MPATSRLPPTERSPVARRSPPTTALSWIVALPVRLTSAGVISESPIDAPTAENPPRAYQLPATSAAATSRVAPLTPTEPTPAGPGLTASARTSVRSSHAHTAWSNRPGGGHTACATVELEVRAGAEQQGHRDQRSQRGVRHEPIVRPRGPCADSRPTSRAQGRGRSGPGASHSGQPARPPRHRTRRMHTRRRGSRRRRSRRAAWASGSRPRYAPTPGPARPRAAQSRCTSRSASARSGGWCRRARARGRRSRGSAGSRRS